MNHAPTLRDRIIIRFLRTLAPHAMPLMWRRHGFEPASISNRHIPGPGGEVRIRTYTPAGPGPFPLMVYFHGGGFVICDLDTHDVLCRDLCCSSGCVVVSVDYRLAPEHRFPAGVEDCIAATRWVAAHAAELHGDAQRLLVAGDSAGGNLAAVVAQQLKAQLAIAGQVLLYPVTDYHTPPTASYMEFANDKPLGRSNMLWFWRLYLSDEREAGDPRACPLRQGDVQGLPPALVITAECDPLRDEGEAYARKLAEAGVAVKAQRFDDMHHGFIGLDGPGHGHRRAIDLISGWIRGLWAHTGSPS